MRSWSTPYRRAGERRPGRALCLAACAALAAPSGARAGTDAASIAADPEAHAGERVTVAVKFQRIDTGRDPWEEQGDLKASRVIKFTVAPFGSLKCYAARTDRNIEALARLKRGGGITLTGSVRKYRPAVRADFDVSGPGGGRGRGRPEGKKRRRWYWHRPDRILRGAERCVFMVDSIERAG
jgi:hypothetical protein